MNFESAMSYLESLVSYEKFLNVSYNEQDFDLEKFRNFLSKNKINYQSLKFVHVAGSKGKGTTCGFIANYLVKAGYKVGLYTSPHILSITERFWLNGYNISEEKFAEYVGFLKECEGSAELTFFEILTALAFKFFVDERVDYAVLEVGLGGRLDATNVVVPELSVLTTVELEHTEILGDTIEKIVDEKLGIVKEERPVLIGFQSGEGYVVIAEKLAKKSGVFYVGGMLEDLELDESGFDLARIKNAKVAFAALKLLLGEVDKGVFKDVFENFKLPGRFDVREKDGKVMVLDMAHTENSMRNLVDALRVKFPDGDFVFLVSIMKNKQVGAMLGLIAEVAEMVWFTCSNKDRGHSGEELLEFYGGLVAADAGKMVFVNESWEEAFRQSFEQLKKNEILVVTGSHFLVSKILQKF